jgi:hypothetical protein
LGSTPAATGGTGFNFGGSTSAAPSTTGLSQPNTVAPSLGTSFGQTSTFGSSALGSSAPSLGSFSANPSTNTFGTFNKPSSTLSGNGGFGGGFGTSAPSVVGGGFGMFNQSSSMPTTSQGFGTFSVSNMQQPPQQQQQQQQQQSENIPLDSKYKDLPDNYKAEFDRVYKEFKAPMIENLTEISRAQGNAYDELYEQLKKIHLNTMELETEQLKLQNEVKPFVEELKPFYHDFHISGTTGLSQIRSRGGGAQGGRIMMLDEELPDKFYLKTAEKLEKRMKECLVTVQYFEKQLAARMKVLEAFSRGRNVDGQGNALLGGRGQYGQVTRVGAAQLILLIKQQSEAFQRISLEVMGVHQAANEIRALYLKTRGRETNPFEAADRREAAEQKYLEEKIKHEQTVKVSVPSTSTTVSNVGGGSSSGASTAASFSTGTPSGGYMFSNKPASTVGSGLSSTFSPTMTTAFPTATNPPLNNTGTFAGNTGFAGSLSFGTGTTPSNNVAALDLAKPTAFGTVNSFAPTNTLAPNNSFMGSNLSFGSFANPSSTFGKPSEGSSGKSGKNKKK